MLYNFRIHPNIIFMYIKKNNSALPEKNNITGIQSINMII